MPTGPVFRIVMKTSSIFLTKSPVKSPLCLKVSLDELSTKRLAWPISKLSTPPCDINLFFFVQIYIGGNRPTIKGKGKGIAHTRLPSVGFRSWSLFLAVSLQVTWVINTAVGCHYFPPGMAYHTVLKRLISRSSLLIMKLNKMNAK